MPKTSSFNQHANEAVAITRPTKAATNAPRYTEALDRGPRTQAAAGRLVSAIRGGKR